MNYELNKMLGYPFWVNWSINNNNNRKLKNSETKTVFN